MNILTDLTSISTAIHISGTAIAVNLKQNNKL